MTCFQPRLQRFLVAAVLAVACDKGTTEPVTLVHPVGTPSGRLTLPGSPTSIAVSSTGVVFVTLPNTNEIARFSAAAPTALMSSYPIAVPPYDVAFTRSGSVALVAAADQDRWVVYSVDVRSGDIPYLRPMDAPPGRVALSRDDSRLFVIDVGDPAGVYSLALTGLLGGAQSTATLIPGRGRAMAVSPTNGALYVVTNFRVARLDPATLNVQMVTGPVPVASQDVVVSADGSRVWYGSPTGTLVALDANSLEKVAEVATGANVNGLALSPDGTQLWATAGGDLLVVDPVGASIVTRITLGGTAGRIAFDRAGATAFVANELGWVDVIK